MIFNNKLSQNNNIAEQNQIFVQDATHVISILVFKQASHSSFQLQSILQLHFVHSSMNRRRICNLEEI